MGTWTGWKGWRSPKRGPNKHTRRKYPQLQARPGKPVNRRAFAAPTKNIRYSLIARAKSENTTPACHYCGCRLTPTSATADHVVPVFMGGRTKKSNIVLACQPCNRAKGHMAYDEFLRRIKRRPWNGR